MPDTFTPPADVDFDESKAVPVESQPVSAQQVATSAAQTALQKPNVPTFQPPADANFDESTAVPVHTNEPSESNEEYGSTGFEHIQSAPDSLKQTASGAGSEALGMAKGTVTGSVPYQAVQELSQIPAEYRAFAQARKNGKGYVDAAKAAASVIQQKNDAVTMLKDRVKEFTTNPSHAIGKAIVDLIPVALGVTSLAGAPEAANAEMATAESVAPEAAEAAQTVKPAGIVQRVKQFVSPKAATQPESQAAYRTGAQASAEDAGVPQVPASNLGIRELLRKPIADAAQVEKGLYKTLNDAAGTAMKSLYDRQEEIQDALDEPTQIANKSVLQQELKTTQTSIADGETKVHTRLGEKATDLLTKAKAATQQRYAMEVGDQKLFNNESVVKGNIQHGESEEINVDSAIRNAENLDKPSKFAPRGTPTRLQQMFGEDGAKAFEQGLYDARKAGKAVMTRNTIVKTLVGGGVGIEALKKILD